MRYVSPSKIIRDDNDKAIGIFPQAFKRRDGEDGLSVTWLEYFSNDFDESIIAAVRASRANPKLTVKRDSGFAIGNVGDILSACKLHSRNSKNIRVVYMPNDHNKSHAEVKWLPNDDQLLDLLATEVWANLKLNKDIPDCAG